MAGWIKNKILGVLESLGWSCDSVEASFTSVELKGLKSSETYRGCSCDSIRITIGLRQGVRLEVSGVRLAFLLSRGEAVMVSPAKDGFNKAPPRRSSTFFMALMTRIIESISMRLLRVSSFSIRDFQLRLESAQSGRSFAATVCFDEFSCNPQSSSQPNMDVELGLKLVDLAIRWETTPSTFVYLGQEPNPIDTQSLLLAPLKVDVNLDITEQMTFITLRANVREQIVVQITTDELTDILSIANGGGQPNAWGLDRSSKALWLRSFEAIKARRQLARDKKVRATLARLHADRLASDSFEEFFNHAQRVLRGEGSNITNSSSSPAKAMTSRPRRFVLTLSHDGLGKIMLKGDTPAEISFANPSPLIVESSSNGTARVHFDEVRLGLPTHTVVVLNAVNASRLEGGSSQLELGGLEVLEEGVTLLRIDKCDVSVDSTSSSKSIQVQDIGFKDEWPRFWNAYLGYKYVQTFFTTPLNNQVKLHLDDDSTATRTQAGSSKVSVGSMLLFAETLTPHIDRTRGFGMQSIDVFIDNLTGSVETTVMRFGMYSSAPAVATNPPAIRVTASREDFDEPWDVQISCKRVPFVLNMPLVLFWTKIKGPPPAHPPITAPITSLLSPNSADQAVRLSLEDCSVSIGEDIVCQVSLDFVNWKSRSFYDAEYDEESDGLKGVGSLRRVLSRNKSGSSQFSSVMSNVGGDPSTTSSSSDSGDVFFDTVENTFDSTHVVEVHLKALDVSVLHTEFLSLSHTKLTIREGTAEGSLVTIESGSHGKRKPVFHIGSIAPIRHLVELNSKLFPYSVPQPKIPLEFKYFPDVNIHLPGVEVFFGSKAKWLWDGLSMRVDARGGGNYTALNQIALEVRGVSFEWNMSGSGGDSSSQFVPVMTFPLLSDDDKDDLGGDSPEERGLLLDTKIDFIPLQRQDVHVSIYGGSVALPFPVLKSIMEAREAFVETLKEASEVRHTKKDIEIEDEHEVAVVMMMEQHNQQQQALSPDNQDMVVVEYGPTSLVELLLEQMFVQVELESDVEVKLLSEIEFRLMAEGDLISTTHDELVQARKSEFNARALLLVCGSPMLHSVSLKASLTDKYQHPERKNDRTFDVLFYESIRVDLEKKSMVQMHRLLKLLEAKTTKKDDLKATTGEVAKDQTVPRLAPVVPPVPTQQRSKLTRIEMELPGVELTVRQRGKTSRYRKVFHYSMGAIKISGLQRRLESRLEIAVSLSMDCLDGIQLLDPARVVVVVRGFGSRHENVLSSVSRPKLDVDVRAIDPLNFNVCSAAVEALHLTQKIFDRAGIAIEEGDGSDRKPDDDEDEEHKLISYVEGDDGGYYIYNDSCEPVLGCTILRSDISLRPFKDDLEQFQCSGWLKKSDTSGLSWTRRFFRCSPLVLTYYGSDHGESARPLGSISLLDPLSSEFMTVTMEGDSDVEWRSIEGASILVRGVGAETVASFLPSSFTGAIRKHQMMQEQRGGKGGGANEAKSVRAFQLAGREAHDGSRRQGRRFRFIAKDTETKIRFLRFLNQCRMSCESIAKTLQIFRNCAIRSEQVMMIEGAENCFSVSPPRKTTNNKRISGTGVTCFAELDGSCISFFSRQVPRRGETPSGPFESIESTRDRYFLGCLDLFFALTIFRENSTDVDAFYIEFAPLGSSPSSKGFELPTRVRLTFDSREQCRRWEGKVAETIAVCFQLRQAFHSSLTESGGSQQGNNGTKFVFSPHSFFKVQFRLDSKCFYHVGDAKEIAVLGTRIRGDEEGLQTFIPDLVASPNERLVREGIQSGNAGGNGSDIFVHSSVSGSIVPKKTQRFNNNDNGEQVITIQGRMVMQNRLLLSGRDGIKCSLEMYPVSNQPTSIAMGGSDIDTDNRGGIVAYGVRNLSNDVMVVSWRLFDSAPPSSLMQHSTTAITERTPEDEEVETMLDVRLNEKFLPGQMRWFSLNPSMSAKLAAMQTPRIVVFRSNNPTNTPSLQFIGRISGEMKPLNRYDFELGENQETSLPGSMLLNPGADREFIPVMRIRSSVIPAGAVQEQEEEEEIIFLTSFFKSLVLEDTSVVEGVSSEKLVQVEWMYSSESPRFVLSATRFLSYHGVERLFVTLGPLIQVENQLPQSLSLFLRSMSSRSSVVTLSADGGRSVESALLCSSVIESLRPSLSPQPCSKFLNDVDFALDDDLQGNVDGATSPSVTRLVALHPHGPFLSDEEEEEEDDVVGSDKRGLLKGALNGRKRIEFPNGCSAYVRVTSGAPSKEDDEDVVNTNRDDVELIEKNEDEVGEESHSTKGQLEIEERLWDRHHKLRTRVEIPLKVTIEALTRIHNWSGLNLFLRPKHADATLSKPMFLRSGQSGFLADEGMSLELATVGQYDSKPALWSRDAFLCRIGVSGAVEVRGSNVSQVFKFAVEVSAMPDLRAGCLVTITSFYMIKNRLQVPLEISQMGTRESLIVLPCGLINSDQDDRRQWSSSTMFPRPSAEAVPFHPWDADGNGVVDDSELTVKVRKRLDEIQTSRWSAPFRVDLVQEILLRCDREASSSLAVTTRRRNDSFTDSNTASFVACDSTNSARVLGDELENDDEEGAAASEEEANDEDDQVFGLLAVLNGPGMELNFVPKERARSAVRYNLVNATRTGDVMGIRESFTNEASEEDELPVIVHPGKTLSYVFRHQSHKLLVSILRYREQAPVEVDMTNLGWTHEFGREGESSSRGGGLRLVLEVTESAIGRCLVLSD